MRTSLIYFGWNPSGKRPLRTGRLCTRGDVPGTHFCYRLSRLQDHNTAGRIKSMKNSSNPIGNRFCDLSVCSVLPKSTIPRRAPLKTQKYKDMVRISASLRIVFSHIYLLQNYRVRERCSCWRRKVTATTESHKAWTRILWITHCWILPSLLNYSCGIYR